MTDSVTRTATVFVRHSEECPDRERGSDWKKCDCRKSLMLYDGATKKQLKVSAKTRSWEKAEGKAREWLEQFDPTKMELKKLQAEREAERGKAAKIEQAVFAYLADMEFRQLSDSTINRTRTLFGDVNADGAVVRSGKLFDWLERQVPRPIFISEVTPQHLTEWRGTWNYGSDLTAAIGWDAVKTFFKFCKGQGWIKLSPAEGVRRPSTAKGNRTATFSDAEYDKILGKAKGNQRLETFLELLRWSGMALIDAVAFNTKTVDAEGVLRYTRQKTDTLATVPLQAHVVALLRSIPLNVDNAPEQPFRRKGISIESNIHEWRRDLQDLFKQAGITKVKTAVGERPAHPHMLRDTCAVWFLRQGTSLHGLAKILGHSNPMITAKHYLPFVTELENAHIAEIRGVLAAAKPKATGSKVRAIA
jgi:integrase